MNKSHTEQNSSKAPSFAKWLSPLIKPLDRLFDWIYSSQYNPMYRSGTIATGLLVIVSITGVYLLFVYRIGSPYESMVEIQNQIFLGRWIRALHRYASDAAMVAVVIHILRLMFEGRTWGPRMLAWVSGVFMLFIMLGSAWTGFVMVWDKHGQELAITKAQILNVIPFLEGIITRSFSGSAAIGSSFFFMNLFLHVALPLAMTIGLYIHTSKLNNPAWVPVKPIFKWLTISLTILSIVWPAALGPGADLLSVGGIYPIDWFYSFFMPIVWKLSAGAGMIFWLFVFFFLASMPWWWRPAKEKQPGKSVHHEESCEGCRQCYTDCPFDAIEMKPRTKGTGSEEVAMVLQDMCVSCGLCSGSCSQLAIGPEDRSGRAQLTRVKELKAQYPEGGLIFIYCDNLYAPGKEMISVLEKEISVPLVPYPVDCLGSIHPSTIQFMQTHFKNVFTLGCPPRACTARDGQSIFKRRMFENLNPAQPGKINLQHLGNIAASAGEKEYIRREFMKFAQANGILKNQASLTEKPTVVEYLKRFIFTAVFLAVIAYISEIPGGTEVNTSFIRMAIRLPGQVLETCRDLTLEELEKRPIHMRKPRECTAKALSYQLVVKMDGKVTYEETISPHGARGDKPLFAEKDIPVEPGSHQVDIEFKPLNDTQGKALVFNYSFKEEFTKGRAILVGYNGTTRSLEYKK